MLISTKHLKAAGCTVKVTNGKMEVKDDLYIEVLFETGQPLPTEIADAVEERVGPEFADALVDGLAAKIHQIQLLEAIRKTERKAWVDRRNRY